MGSFLLGLLVEIVRLHGQSRQRYQHYRLLLGTGFLGSFTTYSALALANAQLLTDNQIGTVFAYGFGMVITGILAALLGILLGQVAKPEHSQDTAATQASRRTAQDTCPDTKSPAVQQTYQTAQSSEISTLKGCAKVADEPQLSHSNDTTSETNSPEGREN